MSLRPPIPLMRAAIPLALVTAAGASAQTMTLDVNSKSTVLVAKADCALPLTVNWSISATGSSPCADHSDLVIWVTKSTSCGTDPGTGDTTVGTVPQSTWTATGSGSFTLDVPDLPVFAGASCPLTDVQQDMKVCAYAKYLPLGAITCLEARPSTAPTITYDSKAPEAPTIDSVVPQDGALLVYFHVNGTDATSVIAAYESTVGPYTNSPAVPAATGSLRLDGLTNDVTYAVLLYALDDAGNRSEPSAAESGTPVQSFGFFNTYENDNGATTGCAVAPAGALPLLALAWMSRRRRSSRGGGRS
jgi:hypothetical protein